MKVTAWDVRRITEFRLRVLRSIVLGSDYWAEGHEARAADWLEARGYIQPIHRTDARPHGQESRAGWCTATDLGRELTRAARRRV